MKETGGDPGSHSRHVQSLLIRIPVFSFGRSLFIRTVA
jgi:hypothetical protein